jgi:hypothetical protein
LTFLFLGAQSCCFLNALTLCGRLQTFLFQALTLNRGALTSLFFGMQSRFLFNATTRFLFGFLASLLRSLTARFTFGMTAAFGFLYSATLFFFSLAQCFYLTTNLLLFLSSLTRLFFNAFAHDLQLGEPAFLLCRAQPCYFYQAQSLLFGEAAGFLKALPFFLCALVDLSLELETFLLSPDARFFFSLYANLFG